MSFLQNAVSLEPLKDNHWQVLQPDVRLTSMPSICKYPCHTEVSRWPSPACPLWLGFQRTTWRSRATGAALLVCLATAPWGQCFLPASLVPQPNWKPLFGQYANFWYRTVYVHFVSLPSSSSWSENVAGIRSNELVVVIALVAYPGRYWVCHQ